MSDVSDKPINNPPATQPPTKGKPKRWRRYVASACLAIVVYVGWWSWSVSGRWGTSKDPAEIRRLTDRLCHIDIPPMFQPTSADGAMWPLWRIRAAPPNRSFLGAFYGWQRVQYQMEGDKESGHGAGYLLLTETTHFGVAALDEQETRQQAELFRWNDKSNLTIGDKRTNVLHVETREFQIHGDRVKFEFIEMSKRRAISGVFPGRRFHGSRPFIALTCMVSEENYDEAAFVRMLESIK